MTAEHVPPRSAGNDREGALYNHDEGGHRVVLRSYTDGHAVPSLCRPCNNGASDRGLPQAYTAWRRDVLGHLNLAAATYEYHTGRARDDLWSLRASDGGAFWLPFEHGRGDGRAGMANLHPGRIARQILGMVLAVQSDRRLLDEFPQLASAYFSDGSGFIGPFSLHVALANTGLAYFASGAMAVTIDATTAASESSDFWMISSPPFLMFLVDGPKAPIAATRIDQWLESPIGAIFSRRDRIVKYPIARRSELLVAMLYGSLLPAAGERHDDVDASAVDH